MSLTNNYKFNSILMLSAVKNPTFTIKFHMYMKTILDVAVDECIQWMTKIKMESYYLV